MKKGAAVNHYYVCCCCCCVRFHDKTKNIWLDKDAFMKFPGKYDLVQLDYSAKVTLLSAIFIY